MTEDFTPEQKKAMADNVVAEIWARVNAEGDAKRKREAETCRATYEHYGHANQKCPGIINRELTCTRRHKYHDSPDCYAPDTTDYDDIAYLRFYHETDVFGWDEYSIEAGVGDIVSIYSGDVNLITHKDGRTQEIPWSCVAEWSHKK